MTQALRIAIVGVGAIGAFIASRLHRLSQQPGGPALQLSALARGETLAVLRGQGLRFHEAGQTHTVPLQLADSTLAGAQSLGPQDLVIVAVKEPALRGLAPQIAALAGEGGRVLLAMNGLPWCFFDGLEGPLQGQTLATLDPEGTLRAHLPSQQVLGCVVHASCRNLGPGEVQHVMGQGLILGEMVGQPSESLAQWVALMAAAGFDAKASARIQADIWYKLWGNMTMNPISALTLSTCDRILDDALLRDWCARVMREASALGARFGCPIDQSPEDRFAVTRKLGAFKTSMLQDREAGRPMEIDALLGVVHEVATRLDQPCPETATLLGLIRLLDASRA